MRHLALLALMLAACNRGGPGGPAAARPADGHLAKQRVPAGWTEQSRQRYDRQTIFDYINGGADRFLKKGFRKLHAARYTNAAKDELTVDLYDLATTANATALFADTRVPRPRPLAVCDGALAHDYGLQLRYGHVYGEITVPRADAGLQAAAASFAKAVCGK